MAKKPVEGKKPTDPFLARIEQWVTSVLDDPKASHRTKAAAATIGIKARAVRHDIAGDQDEGEFFGQ